MQGVLLGEDDDFTPSDVWVALCGVGRFLKHYLGVRRSGPNVVITAAPNEGASDTFLTATASTRNGAGIASGSPIVANFGEHFAEEPISINEPDAKRFRGVLDSYFTRLAGPKTQVEPPVGGGMSPQPPATPVGAGMSPQSLATPVCGGKPPELSIPMPGPAQAITTTGTSTPQPVVVQDDLKKVGTKHFVPRDAPKQQDDTKNEVAEGTKQVAAPEAKNDSPMKEGPFQPELKAPQEEVPVVLAEGIPPGNFVLEFRAPDENCGGSLTLISTDNKGNRKIPPRTSLVAFRKGKVTKGAALTSARANQPRTLNSSGP